jgi:hypothetical protein
MRKAIHSNKQMLNNVYMHDACVQALKHITTVFRTAVLAGLIFRRAAAITALPAALGLAFVAAAAARADAPLSALVERNWHGMRVACWVKKGNTQKQKHNNDWRLT